MQLPDLRIGVLPTNPAQHTRIGIAGNPADLGWLKRLFDLGTGGCQIRPGRRPVRAKALKGASEPRFVTIP
jgi:hypothetical protein